MTRQHQLNLWDSPSLDPTTRVKAAMREALSGAYAAGVTRDNVVDEMNRLASLEGLSTNGNGKRVTKHLLDKWVSTAADGHRVPLHLLLIFCRATGSNLPIKALAAPLGLDVIDDEERKKLAWAEAEIERKKTAQLARRLSQEIGL